ncbi:hypothetical protein [Streptomyces sp. NBC_01022]|uniref:hypothetical protein n=1 Tax=Streptomyces sp. NBC_01022 TaxID=2903723 RepID=UPI002DDA17B4|nr:hypothetical protein [Streptomyces sp. NBC_01022]WRZ78901.1 hypothetical protein OG316_00805 [Streptomyces sp. NBC_01022]WRZ86778.1 hypothetical protein OG316_44090 [Streptomyces sp. NBC_01022]
MNHVLCGLASNAALPPELVDRLITVADEDIAACLAGRTDLTRAQAVALSSRVEESAVTLVREGRLTAVDVDPVTRPDAALALLDEGAGIPEWARMFAADPVPERREKLAACPGLPSDVVEMLAVDPDVRVVAELALWAPAHLAAGLAGHPHAEVRRAVAVNEATPPAVLAALITGEGLPPARRCLVCDREETPFVHDRQCGRLDCDLLPGASCDGSHESTVHDLQHAALQNPAAPTEAVVGFAEHPSMLLRWALAARPDLPPEVGRRLAEDPIPGVRADLAGNPAIDDAVIRALAVDRGHDVQRRLAHNPNVPLDVLIHLAGATRIGATLLPRIASASPAEAEDLAGSPVPAARMLLARRRDLPAGIRDALAADPDAKVVRTIAPHPGLSEVQLRTMTDRHGAQVAAGVATNPDASPALLETLARHGTPVKNALRAIARHRHATASALIACFSDHKARQAAAAHPRLPPQVVVELLADPDGEVAEAAAANPSLPPAVMSDLVPL